MESEASPWSGSRATCQIEHNKSIFLNSTSPVQHVSCGVPQGSILGPLLFLIYINDLCRVSEFSISLYLRMTNLLCSGDDLQTLITNININLSIVFDWFCANKLSLYLKKTNYILFHHKTKPNPFDVSLYLNGIIINRHLRLCEALWPFYVDRIHPSCLQRS